MNETNPTRPPQARQVFLDAKTTGFSLADGHRVIEIGAVEAVAGQLTGRTFQRHLYPSRPIDAAATAAHGINLGMLHDKPLFREVAGELRDWLDGAEVVVFGAPLVVAFLDAELARAGCGALSSCCASVIDCRQVAARTPSAAGGAADLDALGGRFGVRRPQPDGRGALADANLLAGVWRAMADAGLPPEALEAAADGRPPLALPAAPLGRDGLIVTAPTEEETAAFSQFLAQMEETAGRPCLWRTRRLQG